MNPQPETPTQEEKQKNFTCSPNMLFVSYKNLSREEKYLYLLLKSLYWDGKPRSMGLREWSLVTGYSTGALSKMLPRMHKCKLLDAVMERENGKGNSKYRITVLDITDLNKKYYSCSPNERDLLDPSKELVHENTQACSPNEQTCSPKRTRSFTKRDKPVHQNVQDNAVDPPVESDDGTSKDLLKDLLKDPLKIEEREDNVTPAPSLLVASSHTHSSSDVSSFSSAEGSDVQTTQAAPLGHVQSAQGGAIDPPSSVGVPSDDTLNLDTQPISPDPVGECALPADTLPIVTLTHTALTTAQEGTPHERLYEQGTKDVNTAMNLQVSATLSTEVAQGVMAKATAMAPPCVTPMAEVSRVTQEEMIEWVKGAGVKVGKRNEAKNKETYGLLVGMMKSPEDVSSLKEAARHFYDEGDIWIGNLVEDRVVKRWKAGRKCSPHPPALAGTMNEGDANALVCHALSLAKQEDHEITAHAQPLTNGSWCVAISWKTEYINPMKFKSVQHFSEIYRKIAVIWQENKKKEQVR